MKQRILDLLNPNEKNWHDANNDLLLFSLIFEKRIGINNEEDKEFCKTMLGKDLYEYNLTNDDYEMIVDKLKQFITQNSSFSATVAGVLGEANDDDVYCFLFNQLCEKYKNDPCLSISIMRSLNGRAFPGYKHLLLTIIDDKNIDINLKEEAKENLRVIEGVS